MIFDMINLREKIIPVITEIKQNNIRLLGFVVNQTAKWVTLMLIHTRIGSNICRKLIYV